MLRTVQIGMSLPTDFFVDPNAVFQPGMIGQLGVIGNNRVCGVSDGNFPIGIIDDMKTSYFTAPSIDEDVIAPAMGVDNDGTLVTPVDVHALLENPNVVPTSFTTNPVDVELIARNGAVIFPAGTPLNFDMDGDGIPDAIRTVVSYIYQVPGIPGEDSTLASGKVTIWFQRGIFSTDLFETTQRYPINSNLFVSESGLLTTRQSTPDVPGIAVVTGSPSAINGWLEFLLI